MKGRIKRPEAQQSRLILPRVGQIKIGMKNANGYPQSVDYFIPTGKYAGLFTQAYGEKPQTIQIVFPDDDPAKVCNERYEYRDDDGRLIAAGDGDTTVTWSADKIFDSIAAAKAALKNELLDGAGAALDTLNELGDALNNDPNFAATIAAEIANRVRYDAAQALSEPQKAQACVNIGAQAASDVGDTDRDFVGDYNTAKA